MTIIVDHVIDPATNDIVGTMIVETDPTKCQPPSHPTLPRQAVNWAEWAAVMQATPALRAAAGWGVTNQLPGEAAPMTRWARLVIAANAATADPTIKALGLSGV